MKLQPVSESELEETARYFKKKYERQQKLSRRKDLQRFFLQILSSFLGAFFGTSISLLLFGKFAPLVLSILLHGEQMEQGSSQNDFRTPLELSVQSESYVNDSNFSMLHNFKKKGGE